MAPVEQQACSHITEDRKLATDMKSMLWIVKCPQAFSQQMQHHVNDLQGRNIVVKGKFLQQE